MSSSVVALIVLGCTFVAALAGMALRVRLPERYLDEESRDVVKLVMGLIATVAALVLSLLIASAHTAYDRQESEVQQLGINLSALDRTLAHYGPETAEARALLREFVTAELDKIWPADQAAAPSKLAVSPRPEAEAFIDLILSLTPKTDAQRFGQTRALQLMADMGATRQLLYEQAGGSLSWPFFVVLVSWLVALFIGFGMFARFNAAVVTAILVGSLTVSGAIFLILEMSRPYSGTMQISSAPIRNALAHIGR